MDEFDDLKKLWQQSPVTVDAQTIRLTNATHQQRLERTQLRGAILLLLTAGLLLYLGFGSILTGLAFRAVTTYIAIALLALFSAGQSLIGLYVYQRLRSIDVSAPVTEHLRQWEAYYAFRKRLIRINLPLYYLLLNGAFALYFIEILGLMPMTERVIALTLYGTWMLFAWFVLGKRNLRREEDRLTSIMNNLRQQQAKLSSD